MSKHEAGILKLNDKTEIYYSRNNEKDEFYASVKVNGQTLKVGNKSVSGWWRCYTLADLESRIRQLYAEEIGESL